IRKNAHAVSKKGTDNTAIGFNALAVNATGTSNNTAVGSSSLAANTTGTSNTAVGKSSLAANTVGTNNTALGNNALAVSTTGTDNTAIGFNALAVNAKGTSNNGNAGTAAEATTTRIGTSQNKCFIAGIRGVTTGQPNGNTVLIDSNGQLGTTSSSRKVKHNIEDMNEKSENIFNLRPVTFAYNS